MTRKEHLQWCKDRAIEYVDDGDNSQAFASFMSDMRKHEETVNHMALEMGMKLLMSENLHTVDQMREWILGCN